MNKSLILSISRKYLGLLLLVGSLLLIASTNANYTAPTTRSGSVITFLTPKRAPTNLPSSPTDNATNNGVASTTPSNNPVVSTQNPVTSTTNSNEPGSAPVPTTGQNDSSTTTPSDTYVPPAGNDPEMPSYPPPNYGCGSCRPTNKPGPQMMCPQYMTCMY